MQNTIYINMYIRRYGWLCCGAPPFTTHSCECVSSSRLRISKINITFRLKRLACLIFRQFRSIRISSIVFVECGGAKKRILHQFRYMRRLVHPKARPRRKHAILFPLLIVAPISYYFISPFRLFFFAFVDVFFEWAPNTHTHTNTRIEMCVAFGGEMLCRHCL